MFPASCFMKVSKKDSTEKRLAQFILIGGFCLMILGTYANLLAIDEKRSGPSSVTAEEKEIEKITTLENLSSNYKPTDLHQAEKPIELNLPKTSAKKDNINVKSKQDNKIGKDENLSPAAKVIVQSASKAATKNEPSVIKVTPHNADINKDAIKKEEEIAAEEAQKQSKQINEAKDELKKTKELLEKEVKELKEQLKHQNEVANDIVEKKLENIVEKVEQIEREVHKEVRGNADFNEGKEEPINKVLKSALVQEDKSPQVVGKNQGEKIGQTPPPIPKGSLVNMLTESLKSKPKHTETNGTAFEPISYKTGEVINKIIQAQASDGKAPLPLPLLINASVPKSQDIDKKEDIVNQTDENKPAKVYKEPVKQDQIESIRRDILQANVGHDASVVKDIDLENYKREKRNAEKETCVNWDVTLDDCLDKISVDSILPQNMANIKVESIGRDLSRLKRKLKTYKTLFLFLRLCFK